MRKEAKNMDRVTTDELDQTTPEERYDLVTLCQCGRWQRFIGSKHRFLQTDGLQCICGNYKPVPKSLQTYRTWDEKKAMKWKKKAGTL